MFRLLVIVVLLAIGIFELFFVATLAFCIARSRPPRLEPLQPNDPLLRVLGLLLCRGLTSLERLGGRLDLREEKALSNVLVQLLHLLLPADEARRWFK